MEDQMHTIQQQMREIKENLSLIAVRKTQYPLDTDIPLELVKNERRLENELNALNSRLEALQERAELEKKTDGAEIEQDFKKIHVDRQEEKRLFRNMIQGSSEAHILLIEADKGMGKTSLLKQFWEISQDLKRARINFKNPSYTVGEILGEMSFQLGEHAFTIFRRQCQNLAANSGLSADSSMLFCSFIDAALMKLASEEQKVHRQMITDAFIADVAAIHETIQTPVTLQFDTFENASNDVKIWFNEQFITRIRRYPWLSCVIAGRQTLRIDSEENDWCLQHTLAKLPDKDVREYIQQVKLTQSEDLITFITFHAKGHPYTLEQLVVSLSKMPANVS